MKKILFVVVAVALVWLTGEKANAFEINGVVVDGNQVVLQTTYGGNISLEKGQNAVPLIIELSVNSRSAVIRKFLEEKRTTVVILSSKDFHAFSLFLQKTSDRVGICYSGAQFCGVYIFF